MPSATQEKRAKPRYLELADAFIGKIEAGEYPIGSHFPTEFEICQDYAVSRHTARAALARLNALGLLHRRPGAGTRVIAEPSAMRYQQEVDSIEDLLQYGQATRLEILEARRMLADAELAEALAVETGSELIRLFGVRYGEPRHDPICTTVVHLRPGRDAASRQLLTPETASRALYRILDLRRIGQVEQVFDAAELPREHARLLGVRHTVPALRAQRRYFDADGRPLARAVSLHPTGRFAYRMMLRRKA